jgi:hypothetical protein
MDTDQDAMQKRAIAVIQPLIPSDAEDRVMRAVRQYDRIVRERIREETRLSLGSDADKGSIPVRVVNGFPASVAGLVDKFHDAMLWRLITLQPKIGGVVEGLVILLQHWSDFESWRETTAFCTDTAPALERTLEVANKLQTLAASRKVIAEVKEIKEDILGAYWHMGPGTPKIEIYWMAQALFAAAFGVRIEDLTVVTLAHELAHGYTHLGRDADGKSWITGFGTSDKEVTEGLAQHYTAAITEELRWRVPDAHAAYERLLEHQSGPYLAHRTWFDSRTSRRAEIVRFAMLRARTSGRINNSDWLTFLDSAQKALSQQ